jgi:UDP-N-acetylmuramoyl-tripeptide--D-alanyl-D-alanine ligase
MFSIEEIASLLGGDLAGGGACTPTGFVADSRRAGRGDVFFALPGEKADGHAFVADAFARGAAGAIVSDRSLRPPESGTLLYVDDVRAALQTLSSAWRSRLSVPVVGITGSNGKTTTKALVAHFAGGALDVYAAQENYNTDIGLPLALLAMPQRAELGVFELGADRPGDISLLCRVLHPTTGILTSVGPSHLELFGTTRAIADEKWNLVRALSADAAAFVNADSPELAALANAERRPGLVTAGIAGGDVHARLLTSVPHLAIAVDTPPLHLETALVGEQNATNLLLAALCAITLGVPSRTVEERARSFRPVPHRMELRRARFGVVIDDVYNANPASMSAALKALAAFGTPLTRRVVVFGDMLGLGERSANLHDEVVRRTLALPVDAIYPVGERAEAAFRAAGDERVRCLDRQRVAADAVTHLARERDAVVLVKGSRGVQLEDIVDEILRLAPPAAQSDAGVYSA